MKKQLLLSLFAALFVLFGNPMVGVGQTSCLVDDFNTGYGNWTNGSGTYQNTTPGLTGNGTGFNHVNDDIYTGSTITNPQSIVFWLGRSSNTSNKTFSVQYSTDGTTWNVAQDILVGSVTTTHQQFTVALNLTGVYYLRFIMSQRSGGSYYLDDVEVFCGALPPSNCTGTMSGTYTIDASQPASCTNYQDFASAISDMVNGSRSDDNDYRHDGGISGAVVFEVATDTYTEQISIGEVPGASATNTVTFKSASGTNTDVVLQHPSSGTFGDPDYTLQLNGCDYVTFENMTIQRTGTNNYYRVIDVSGDASYNTITGNILTGDEAASPNTSRSQVVYSDDANTGNTHNTISNNTIRGGYHGIYWQGTSSNTESDLTISGNNIASYRYGMYLRYIDDMTISGNTITTPTQFNSSSTEGIYCFNADGRLDITGNTVTLTGGNSNTGIELAACAGSGSAVGDISNNMVVVGGTNTSEGITSGSTTSYKNYYYNSVYNTGTNATTASAFYMNGSNHINIKNNAFFATVGNAIEIITTSAVLNSDYNLLYSTGAYVGYWGGNRATLADYQTASSGDANSISADPGFVSATDLHVNPGSPTDATATVLAITTDIDGETRHATTPDIGADEFNNTLPVVTLSASVNTGSEAAQTVITLTATASVAVTGAQTINVSVAGTGITAGDYTLSATTITIPNGGTSGSVTFTIIDDILDEGDETAEVSISHPSSGGYVIGFPNQQDILIEDNDAPTCYELFISEYVEGSGNNKYIEIYNPTASAIDLSSYTLKLYANGATSPNSTQNLTGSLAAYSTIVYANSSASAYGGTVTTTAVCNFNGDDAIVLEKSGTNIDIFGRIGQDPGSEWSEGGNQTADQTLVRNADVEVGVDVNPTGTFTTLATEWTQHPQDNVSNLGSHTCDCFVSLPVVTLSTNTTTGTETAQTEIILTATADVAVTGDQTVVVALDGTGVTATDFTNVDFTTTVTITILGGDTEGTLTFNVNDDSDIEGTETATFTIGSPSGGIVVGTPNQVSVTIDDNDNVTATESVIIEQGGEATGISSLSNGIINTDTEGTQVWAFNLYDGDGSNDDVDDKPTIYENWNIRPGTGNTVLDWSAIDNVKFFLNGSATPIAGSFLVNAASIYFAPSTPITVADGTTPAVITMRITLDVTLPPNSDGKHFVFSLDNSDVTVESDVLLSSQLGTFTEVSDAALNGIDIVATLQFIDAPTAVSVGSNFSVTVSAVDANGNVDTGISNSITLSLTSGSGTLTGAPVTVNLTNGTHTFPGLSHDTEEVIEITVHDNDNVFGDLTANITVTDEPHQLFDDFNRADNYTVGIPSSGGSTAWTEDESGDGTKIRIFNNGLMLDNCVASDPGGSSGLNTNEQIRFNVESYYETVFDNAGSELHWQFNMRSNNSNLAGFSGSGYGMAFILGSNQPDFNVSGSNGYAVVVGEAGTTDYIRLVAFTNGLASTLTEVASSNLDINADHASIRVVFDPCSGEWALYVRNDGSSFTAPNLNIPAFSGPFIGANTTYTGADLKYLGALWKHNSSCVGNDMFLDNINIPNATSASTTAKVWNGSVNDDWNEANNWGPCPGVPTITDNVEIPNVANQPIISAATPVAVCNNLLVDAGATLTINSARELTADGNVTNNGTVTVENSGSFIQTQNGTAAHAGTGNFVVKRQSVGGYNGWSTPVVGGNLPGNNGYRYNSAAGTSDPTDDNNPNPDPGWVAHSGAMTAGQGYYASNAGLATFTGKANNGTINKAVTHETAATPDLPGTRYNLVGNPYPSAIDADQFITNNSGVIDGSIYFWDDDNTGPGNYTLDDYATYTLAGAVPTLGGSNGGGPTPNGSIGSAQGFFVSCSNSGNITFTNAQRGGSNNQFFRMAAPDAQRMWLSINNDNLQLFNQTLVSFDEFATDQKDWGVDALKFRGNQEISIGAQQDNETYVVATYASIPQNGKVIPLMTYVETAATYTFVADSMEGFDNHHVFLEDLSNEQLYPLTQGDAYSFAMTSADEYNRFQLWFSPMVITDVEEAENEFSIYATQNNAIVVETTNAEAVKGTIQITDMAGRLVLTNDISIANGIGRIQIAGIANGIYAITFVTADGNRTTSQKVALSR